ncbi:MAG TPA: L-aspartate oxidase [Vicinamibacterales bacterium]|nr:L-aspartate oxidase [Vicinamibacterales bacterium]
MVGSGIAALRAAASLAGHGDVLILTKAEPEEGNTGHAQGGIAAAIGPDDSPALHLADTIAAGDGLCNERAAAVLVGEGPRYVRELIDWGVPFDRGADGRPALAIEAAHSVRRVLHVRDATGREIGRTLWRRVSPLPGIHVHAHARVIGLTIADGRCAGAVFVDESGTIGHAVARCTLLATGGAGQVFRETTNPRVATGDGIAMAWRAGAAVADMEFVQFHPTALKVSGQPRFLLSEALRGEGARLVNAAGEPFMTKYDPAGDLAPRDRVARGIAREAEATGAPVYLQLGHLDPAFVHDRFPLIAEACRRAGLDLARDPIPVGPAAHYIMGGVVSDLDGRTTIPGLYAAGEVACTGVHGANRLASNSLLEGLVFGARAAAAMQAEQRTSAPGEPASPQPAPFARAGIGEEEVRDLMWRRVGLFRDAAGLTDALATLDPASASLESVIRDGAQLDAQGWRVASLVTVGRLIARAALDRRESRGAHYRGDNER